jgi:hypothetical protein
MRVGFRDLTLWSFMMASAHGAGLMLMPILLGWAEGGDAGHTAHLAHSGHLQHLSVAGSPLGWLAAVGMHSAGYLLVAALIALVIYEKLGLAILRRAWFNLDLLWVIALMLSGILIFLV